MVQTGRGPSSSQQEAALVPTINIAPAVIPQRWRTPAVGRAHVRNKGDQRVPVYRDQTVPVWCVENERRSVRELERRSRRGQSRAKPGRWMEWVTGFHGSPGQGTKTWLRTVKNVVKAFSVYECSGEMSANCCNDDSSNSSQSSRPGIKQKLFSSTVVDPALVASAAPQRFGLERSTSDSATLLMRPPSSLKRWKSLNVAIKFVHHLSSGRAHAPGRDIKENTLIEGCPPCVELLSLESKSPGKRSAEQVLSSRPHCRIKRGHSPSAFDDYESDCAVDRQQLECVAMSAEVSFDAIMSIYQSSIVETQTNLHRKSLGLPGN